MKAIPMPIHELCDRLTIVTLKLDRLPESEIDKNELRKQHAYYMEGIDKENSELMHLLALLKTYNGMIWDLEYDLRKGLDEELGLEEIGRRAIEIRNINRFRVDVKNKISELMNQHEFKDCKMNHLSE